MTALGCCGLFIAQSDKPVPLTNVAYEVEVKGFASSTTIHQTYKNAEKADLECVYAFPMNDQAAVTGFTVKIGNRTLTSQFKKKEEAFKDYSRALEEGHGAYLLDQSDRSDDTFVLSVGRLPPGHECTVSITYVSLLDAITETKQRLVIPTALSPRYNPGQEKTKGSVAPPETYSSSVPYMATLKGKIETLDAVKTVSSPSHPISVTIESANMVTVSFGASQQPLDRDLVIDIELKSNPQHVVLVDKLANDQYVAMYSFVPNFEKADCAVKSDLVFVVDCSGSMQGDRITDAKRTMGIFLRSIPEGCYFNIYRFGSAFESLFPKSELYSAETFAKAKDYAQQTEANLGGTEILQPLQHIFATEVKSGFPRQLFVLTDGEVTNTDAVIALVRSNAHNSRVFSFGIGDSPSRTLINGIASAGNGKSEYAKKGEDLEDEVGRHLSRALQPSVTDAAVLWEGFRNVQQVPSILPPVFRGDRQIAFAFFNKSESSDGSLVLHVQGKMHQIVRLADAKATESWFLEKLAARALIKELEIGKKPVQTGSLQNRQIVQDKVVGLEERITEISLGHGVMSKYVSLVAVEKRETDQKSDGLMELREIPVLCNEPGRRPGVGQMWGGGGMNFKAMPSLRGGGGPMPSFGGGNVFGAAPVENYGTVHQSLGFGCAVQQSSGFGYAMGAPAERRHAAKKRKGADGSVGDEVAEIMDLCGWAAVEEERVDSLAKSSKGPQLHSVLDLQKWDGSWEFSQELERHLGVTRDSALKTAKNSVDGDVLATLLVIAFLKAKFGSKNFVWGAMVTKARVYVRKTVVEKDQDSLISVLEKLF